MSWPLSQDYNEAIQSPRSNFSDPDLQRGEAACNALGLPMPYSGNFADVYQVRCPDGSRWAVKCFTREVAGLRERYQKIGQHLAQAKLPFMVDFSYLDQGMRVGGQWFPVLKMQWVEGLTLNQFVGQYLDRPARLEALAHMWARMGLYLRAARVAHCDLQHGNVLLVPGADSHSLKLKLIDYDGMWVPDLAGTKSGEVGHPSYQHPQRLREQSYNIDVDRFPLLLIATALRALKARGKELWDKYDNGDNLLFKEPDLREPLKSYLFLDLTKTDDAVMKPLVDHLIKALRGGLETTPLLEELMPDAKAGSTPAPPTRRSKLGGSPSGAGLDRSGPQEAAPVASPVAVAPVPAPVAWDFAGSAPAAEKPKRQRETKSAAGKWGRVAAICVLVLGLLGGVAIWAMSGGKPKESRVAPTPPPPIDQDAVLALQIDQPGAEVSVDGQKQDVDVAGDYKPVAIRLKPGTHTVAVSKDGFKTVAQEFRLASGQRSPISVRLVALVEPTTTQIDSGKPLDPAPTTSDGFTPLFNGKDLTGWKTHSSQAGNWHVENGILISSGNSVSHLYTNRGDYTDFDLRMETRGGSSGINFRSGFGPTFPHDQPQWVLGYNAKLEAYKFGGLIIGEDPLLIRTRGPGVMPAEWSKLEIIAVDNHIVVKMNDITTVDYTDDNRCYTKGRIAIEHLGYSVAEFRMIEIKELPPAKP